MLILKLSYFFEWKMPYIGEISALVTAFLWSASSFLFTDISKKVGSIKLNIYRLAVACVLILLTILIGGFSYSATFNQILLLSISGVVGLTIGDSFLFKAFSEIGPRLSMLIMASNPGMAALIAWIVLGESLSIWGIAGIIITLGGIVFVVMEKSEGSSSKYKITRNGLIFAFIAALGQAVGLIFAKLAKFDGEINAFTATFIRLASALIFLYPSVKFGGRLKTESNISSKTWGKLVLASVIGPYLGISLSFIAILNTKVGIASTIMSMPPVIMLPIIYFYYKEKLSWKAVFGAIIAVIGVSILFLK